MSINKEMLKGHIDTMLLALIGKSDRYGYELAKAVREANQDDFELKEGTLYLALKRLEKTGSLTSYWGEDQGTGGRRKYYSITENGKTELEKKQREWNVMKHMMDHLLGEGKKNETN